MQINMTKDILQGDNFLNVHCTSEYRKFNHDITTELELILDDLGAKYGKSEKDLMVRNDLGSSLEMQITYHILEPTEELDKKLFMWKLKV